MGAAVALVLIYPYVFLIHDQLSAASDSMSILEATKIQLSQVGSRLFPFVSSNECVADQVGGTPIITNACHERGLVHAYWAANVWACYLFTDRLIMKLAVRVLPAAAALPNSVATFFKTVVERTVAHQPSPTAGLVGRVSTIVLPEVTPAMSAFLSLVALLPACVATACAASQGRKDNSVFEFSLAYASLSSFVFGWHVHEKAILGTLLPLALLAAKGSRKARLLYVRLSALGLFALFPLFTHTRETPTKCLIFLAYMRLTWCLLESRHMKVSIIDCTVSAMALGLFTFSDVIGHRGLEFLPLMLTSVMCSGGILICWIVCAVYLTKEAGRMLRS